MAGNNGPCVQEDQLWRYLASRYAVYASFCVAIYFVGQWSYVLATILGATVGVYIAILEMGPPKFMDAFE